MVTLSTGKTRLNISRSAENNKAPLCRLMIAKNSDAAKRHQKQQMQTKINSFRHIRRSFFVKVLWSRASHFSSSEYSAFACCFQCIRLSAVARTRGIKWGWQRHVDLNGFVKCHLARPDHAAQ
jgi:hypothetical protein